MSTYSQALGGNFQVLMRPTPVNAGEEEKQRVCLNVNKKIDPKTWSVRHRSRDLSALTVRMALGTIDIHHIYVSSKVGNAAGSAAGIWVPEGILDSLALRDHRGHK